MVKKTVYSIFALRLRQTQSNRVLPLYKIFCLVLNQVQDRQKKPLQYYILSLLLLFVTFYLVLVTAVHAEPPNRIISLAPNLTEILFAMGLGDRIVGVTNFCDYPEDSKGKPKVGGMYNPSLEAVVSLRPDMVIVTPDGNLKEFEERLRSLSIRTYIFKARRLYELSDEIRRLGGALGFTEKAEVFAKDIEEAFNRYKALGTRHKGKKSLFIIWPEPLIVAGSGTAIDDAISLLGYENIASKANIAYPKYSVEEIMRQAPDVIFIGKGHADVKAASRNIIEKLSEVPAVKHGEVYFISDSIYRLGPRIIQGIDEMARCLK